MNAYLIDETKAAEQLGISVATLCKWRCTRRVNLPFVKLGKAVRYRPEDLENFIKAETVGGVNQ